MTTEAAPPALRTTRARILIVEDFPIVRDGLAQLIGSSPELEVIDAVGDESSARASLQRERPDLILLDLMLGGTNGLTFIADLIRE